MLTAVIVLSLITTILIWKICKNRVTVDETKMFQNRKELWNLVCQDWKQGKISFDIYQTLLFVSHPDFGNSWDYVPPERQTYTSKMYKFDSNFWKSHKLTPDFAIPATIVYQLYKEYASKHINEYFMTDSDSKPNPSSQKESES